MPSAPPFEKGVVGGAPLGHLATKSGLAHKRIRISRLTFLLKDLITFGFPFQGYRFGLVFQRRDHHQQAELRSRRNMKPLGWECLGRAFGESHEAVSKIKLNTSKAVLSAALVKLQAGSREHLCPPSCTEAGAALGSQGSSPSPAISAGWGAAAAG